MKKWLLLFLLASPSVVRAEMITPQFTQGSMQSTTTTTQEDSNNNNSDTSNSDGSGSTPKACSILDPECESCQ